MARDGIAMVEMVLLADDELATVGCYQDGRMRSSGVGGAGENAENLYLPITSVLGCITLP